MAHNNLELINAIDKFMTHVVGHINNAVAVWAVTDVQADSDAQAVTSKVKIVRLDGYKIPVILEESVKDEFGRVPAKTLPQFDYTVNAVTDMTTDINLSMVFDIDEESKRLILRDLELDGTPALNDHTLRACTIDGKPYQEFAHRAELFQPYLLEAFNNTIRENIQDARAALNGKKAKYDAQANGKDIELLETLGTITPIILSQAYDAMHQLNHFSGVQVVKRLSEDTDGSELVATDFVAQVDEVVSNVDVKLIESLDQVVMSLSNHKLRQGLSRTIALLGRESVAHIHNINLAIAGFEESYMTRTDEDVQSGAELVVKYASDELLALSTNINAANALITNLIK